MQILLNGYKINKEAIKTKKLFAVLAVILVLIGAFYLTKVGFGRASDKSNNSSSIPNKGAGPFPALTLKQRLLRIEKLMKYKKWLKTQPKDIDPLDVPMNKWINVPIDLKKVKLTQIEVDNGHRPGLLDPEQVASDFLYNQLGIKDKMLSIQLESKKNGEANCLIVYQNGIKVKLNLVQPLRKGPTGIWAVKRYFVPR